MGLDIAYYEGPMEKVDTVTIDLSEGEDLYDVLYERGAIKVHGEFPGRERPLEAGRWYQTGGRGGRFRAGSYSGYGHWREELSRFAYNVAPEVVWNNPERYEGKPFYEIVYFSDCEGTIGPEVAAKLAADFEEYREAARKAWPSEGGDSYWGDYRIELYERFAEAFKVAAETGGVVVWQ